MNLFGGQSMVAPLRRVIVKRPAEAFRDTEQIGKQWKELAYVRPPHLDRASADHARFVDLMTTTGVEVLYLPVDECTGLDSLYAHDPVLITDRGAIIFQMGKAARRGEGPGFAAALRSWNVPILGSVDGDATAEAGDMVWLDQHTLIVGRSFRTNDAGITKLAELLHPLGVKVIPVPLPCWNGPADVLHLMSFISLLDTDLAVVYRRLVPVPLFELLNARGVQLVDVPEEEYEGLGCNVLALAPRRVVMVSGNPITRSRLESAGCHVSEFDGTEICIPGAGGPTCLTRPLLRANLA
jgi:N-dimethylarginine dimethylaminohydrolase